jgi:hypothetical protein
VYSGDPQVIVNAHAVPNTDTWEIWDPIFNRLLQTSDDQLDILVTRGEMGLLGLYRLLVYLVEVGVDACLIDPKVERLRKAMARKCVYLSTCSFSSPR